MNLLNISFTEGVLAIRSIADEVDIFQQDSAPARRARQKFCGAALS